MGRSRLLLPKPRALRKAKPEEVVLKVPSMHCQECAGTIQEALRRLAGVASVSADPLSKLVTLAVRDGVGREDLCAAVNAVGHVCGEE